MTRRFGRTSWLATLALAAFACGCSGGRTKSLADQTRASAGPGEFRIGVMTGAAARHPDEFRAGQQLAKQFGARVRHITYPDDYAQEQETIVAQLTGLAADPDVRVIVVGQAVPGAVDAARRIRELRPDVLIGFVSPLEDAALVNGACDLAVGVDEPARGRAIAAEAAAMGARALVYYADPADSSRAPLVRRGETMRIEAAKLGLPFETITVPDGGAHAVERFYDTDVPRALATHGAATCFFGADRDADAALLRAALEHGGYIAEGASPSPLAVADALGADVAAEHADDATFVADANRHAVAARGRAGHFGAWVAPPDQVAIVAVANLLVDAVEKGADYRDRATVLTYLREQAGPVVRLRKFDEASGNQYYMTLEHVVY